MKKRSKRAQQEESNRVKRSSNHEFIKLMTETGLCAGVGALAGAANYFYDYSMKPIRRDTSADHEPQQQPYMRGRAWMNRHPQREDWYEKADDGLRIHANFIPAPEPEDEHRYAICVHGYSDSAESMGQYAQVYRDIYGMNVLLPDLRGHGKSEGTYVGYGYHDRLDLIVWIDKVLNRDPEAVIILHGISMGAATCMMATGEKLPSNVKACIEDAGFTSAMEEFGHVYGTLNQKPPVPADVILPMLRSVALIRAGYDLNYAAPIEAVKRSVTPTLFIHGEADSFIPSSMMTKLFGAANCEKMSLLVPGAEHVMSVVADPEKYWKKVDVFLRNVDPELVVHTA